jgi:DMSO/TMAO reductase YedYZ molybdopterin-dependent catalytic subunit
VLIRRPPDIPSSEITDQRNYLNRRRFLGAAGVTLASVSAGLALPRAASALFGSPAEQGEDELTPKKSVTSYNNFYEFGTGKDDPAKRSHTLRTRPWTVRVDGEVHAPRTFDIDEILRSFPAEERIYRLRCVEAWSMVIPWLGFPLRDLLDAVEPTSHARFVERGHAEPERSAHSARGAVEVRFQEHQVHRAHSPHSRAARSHMECSGTRGIRVLCERESRGGPSAVEPGARTPDR